MIYVKCMPFVKKNQPTTYKKQKTKKIIIKKNLNTNLHFVLLYLWFICKKQSPPKKHHKHVNLAMVMPFVKKKSTNNLQKIKNKNDNKEKSQHQFAFVLLYLWFICKKQSPQKNTTNI